MIIYRHWRNLQEMRWENKTLDMQDGTSLLTKEIFPNEGGLIR